MNRRASDHRAVGRRGRLSRTAWAALRGWCGSRTWAAIFMLGIIALAAVLNTLVLDVASPAARISLVCAVVWTAFTVVVVVRRRVGSAEIVFFVAASQVLATLAGIAYGRGILQAQAVLGLLAIALVGSMFFSARGIVIGGAGSLAGIVVIVCVGPASVGVKVVAATTTSAIVLATVATVTVLVGRLSRARQAAEAMAGTDQLTGLLNRRGMRDGVATVVESARRERHLVAMVSADVDHFKRVNDTYGHAVGDDVLVAVARAMGRVTRADGMLVRLGGEELAWIAVFPRPLDVDRAAERVRATVEATTASGVPEVTVSIGVACAAPADHADAAAVLSHLLTEADEAMYAAKRAGRNCVVRAGAAAPNTIPTGLAAVTARALSGVLTPGRRSRSTARPR